MEKMTDRWTPSPFASDVAPPPELHARIRAAIAATPAPRVSSRLRVAAALAIVPCVAAAVLLIAARLVYGRPIVRPGLGSAMAMDGASHLLILLILLVGLTLAVTLVAVARGRRGLGPGVVSLAALSLLVTPLHAALALGGWVPVGEAIGLKLSPWGVPCLHIATAVGLLVLATFTVALRRSVPVASSLRGAALGAAAGAWAGLTVFVFCPAGEHQHLLVGHVLPIAAFTLLGLAVTPRLLRV
jgi:hypothetical protein